jgi:hypothetical protein
VKSVLSVQCTRTCGNGFTIFGCPLKEKNKYKISACFFQSFIKSKDFLENDVSPSLSLHGRHRGMPQEAF